MASPALAPQPAVTASPYPPIDFATGQPAAPLSSAAVPPTPDPPSDPTPAVPVESTPLAEPPASLAGRADNDPANLHTLPSILASPTADSFLDADGTATAAKSPGGTAGKAMKPPPGYPGAAENGAGAEKGEEGWESGSDAEAGDGTRGDLSRGGGGFFSRLKRFFKKELVRCVCGNMGRPHHGGYGRPGRYRPRPHGHHGGYSHHGHHGRPGRHGRHGRPRPHGHHNGDYGHNGGYGGGYGGHGGGYGPQGGYGPPGQGPTAYSLPGYRSTPPPGYPA